MTFLKNIPYNKSYSKYPSCASWNIPKITCAIKHVLDHVVIDANGLITWEIVGSYVIDVNGLIDVID
jgi:hypothetical protein